ncbi:vWA domain-containing protein [Coprobacillaceae bacterium CR2/5/TPMF4]|nr:vWA domain-containing protein [Coprobacillaceae bacterium CR2/5/TPMF4]
METVLKEDAGIGLVTYNSNANIISDFSVDYDNLEENVDSLDCNGNTNIGDGLEQAYDMLENSNAKTKIIVLMSDGVPNVGKEGNALISYADQIKDSDILIYTLGFFEKMDDKSRASRINGRNC